jgi:hypothetical protein
LVSEDERELSSAEAKQFGRLLAGMSATSKPTAQDGTFRPTNKLPGVCNYVTFSS